MKKLLNRYWIKTTEFGHRIGITNYSEEDIFILIDQNIKKELKIVLIEKITLSMN